MAWLNLSKSVVKEALVSAGAWIVKSWWKKREEGKSVAKDPKTVV